MKSPPRLVRDDPGFARLVDAMRKDAPSEEEMSKALSAAAKIAALPPVPTPGGPSWLGRSWIQTGLTIIGVTAVLGGLAAASIMHEQAVASSPASSLSVPASRGTIPLVAAAPAAASVRIEELPSTSLPQIPPPIQGAAAQSAPKRVEPGVNAAKPHSDNATSRPVAGGAAPSAPASITTPPGQGTFTEELALTSEARASLERGDHAACLATVDRYQKRFRSGVFAQEIDVIGIEALAKSGARARAHGAAERFLLANPGSPYADRVRSVFGNTKD